MRTDHNPYPLIALCSDVTLVHTAPVSCCPECLALFGVVRRNLTPLAMPVAFGVGTHTHTHWALAVQSKHSGCWVHAQNKPLAARAHSLLWSVAGVADTMQP